MKNPSDNHFSGRIHKQHHWLHTRRVHNESIDFHFEKVFLELGWQGRNLRCNLLSKKERERKEKCYNNPIVNRKILHFPDQMSAVSLSLVHRIRREDRVEPHPAWRILSHIYLYSRQNYNKDRAKTLYSKRPK
jgi:hypothetical protein